MIYEVVVDISNSEVDRIFDYESEQDIEIGTRVKVPFGPRQIEGFIIAKKESSQLEKDKIKQIACVADDFSAISSEMLGLMHFMAEKLYIRYIDSLRLFLPSEMRGDRVRELKRKTVSLSKEVSLSEILKSLKSNAVKQKAALDFLIKNGNTLLSELSELFGNATISALSKKKYVHVDEISVNRTPYSSLKNKSTNFLMTEDQEKVRQDILVKQENTYLLFGVTGSGKTEVYMSIVDEMLAKNKTAIFLVPEISLTPQFLSLFRSRYGEKVAILHSGLSAGERFDEWLRLKSGKAQIALGARSAIFAPLENLGVIVIDEEHDTSYQSDSNPRYSTFDIAKFRQEYNKCTLILGSATPSVTTFQKTRVGEIELLELKKRINKMPLPDVKIVDMANEVRSGNRSFFSEELIKQLKLVIDKGEQAMIFLNRRGYSSFVMCNQCGYVPKCSDCDVSLSFHAEDSQLKCHYCGKKYHMFDLCPNCKSPYLRQGKVGTERIVGELQKIFANTKILRMDFDTTQTKESHLKILESFAKNEAQVLVGTQMIAKGHDFPGVTLVGIIDADQSLHFSDYRANERTFQLLTQVSGRCGRDSKKGLVVLQTYSPGHFVLKLAAKQDYLSFYSKEINIREVTKFPPYSQIIRILYQSENEQSCIDRLNLHYEEIQRVKKDFSEGFIFLQKMKSPVKKIERKFRYQVIMKLIENSEEILKSIYGIIRGNTSKDVSVFVETNPQNLN